MKKDASTIDAYVEMPQAIDKTITYKYDLSENSPKHSISANELEFITLSNIKSLDINHRLDYIKINENERRWANYMSSTLGNQRKVIDAVLEVAREIDFKHGTDIVSKCWENIVTGNFKVYP